MEELLHVIMEKVVLARIVILEMIAVDQILSVLMEDAKIEQQPAIHVIVVMVF